MRVNPFDAQSINQPIPRCKMMRNILGKIAANPLIEWIAGLILIGVSMEWH